VGERVRRGEVGARLRRGGGSEGEERWNRGWGEVEMEDVKVGVRKG
jgi:hypothetical protein